MPQPTLSSQSHLINAGALTTPLVHGLAFSERNKEINSKKNVKTSEALTQPWEFARIISRFSPAGKGVSTCTLHGWEIPNYDTEPSLPH
jgi:hypothetical protein